MREEKGVGVGDFYLLSAHVLSRRDLRITCFSELFATLMKLTEIKSVAKILLKGQNKPTVILSMSL